LVLGVVRIFPIVNVVIRLVVAGEEQRLAVALDAVAEIDDRMIQQGGGDGDVADLQ